MIDGKMNGWGSRHKLPWQQIVAMYENGDSLGKIGAVFGVSYMTINRVLKRRGIKLRVGNNKPAVPGRGNCL